MSRSATPPQDANEWSEDRRLLAARLLDAPLPQLLSELNFPVLGADITGDEFYGAVIKRRDGRIVLLTPPGRSEFECETVTRGLLAQLLDLDGKHNSTAVDAA
ncbi:hypothetical protein [Streptomyces olivaceiscleroticus]|uniref:Uncharacterized protein n=1 Tax=Streptomyces olivaceiscleroticus TaxID=68245 RepID=A0ABP3KDJ7_9ACTN